MQLCLIYYSSWVSFQRFLKHNKCMSKVFLLQHVGYSYLISSSTWSCVETCCGSHHNGVAFIFKFAQTPAAEFLCIVNRQLRYRIESVHRYRRVYTRNPVQTVNETFTSFNVFVVDISQIALRCIQRCFSNNLANQWR